MKNDDFVIQWGYDDEFGVEHVTGQSKFPIEICDDDLYNKIHKDTSGYIYLVECVGLYKIGRTKNLSSRITSFSTIMPVCVTLVHSFHSMDYLKAEKTLHEKYAHFRKTGEWFDLTREQISEICEIGDDEL